MYIQNNDIKPATSQNYIQHPVTKGCHNINKNQIFRAFVSF